MNTLNLQPQNYIANVQVSSLSDPVGNGYAFGVTEAAEGFEGIISGSEIDDIYTGDDLDQNKLDLIASKHILNVFNSSGTNSKTSPFNLMASE